GKNRCLSLCLDFLLGSFFFRRGHKQPAVLVSGSRHRHACLRLLLQYGFPQLLPLPRTRLFQLDVALAGKGASVSCRFASRPFVLLAHPIGFLWLAGAALFIALWIKLPSWWKLAVPAAAVLLVFAIRSYFLHQTRFPVDWVHDPFYLMTGADQLTLYGHRYA